MGRGHEYLFIVIVGPISKRHNTQMTHRQLSHADFVGFVNSCEQIRT
jgi:hypothetical protein